MEFPPMWLEPAYAAKWHGADYAAKRLAEIKSRHYPNGNTLQMVADFDWLVEEVEYLRGAESRPTRGTP